MRTKAIQGIHDDPDTPEALEEIAGSVLDVVERTVREGKTDVGATLVLAPGSFKFVAGVRVADGHALVDAFQKLFELARHQGEVPEMSFYAGKHGDLDLHTLSFPIAESDREARKMLGENVDITVATGPESLFFALGKGGDSLLRTVVDKSLEIGDQKVPPIHLRVALKPVTSFLASIDNQNEQHRAMAELMERSTGGDAILLKVEPIKNGIGCRLEIEEGVLELAGKASRQ